MDKGIYCPYFTLWISGPMFFNKTIDLLIIL